MDGTTTILVEGALLCCPRCLTANDKSGLIAETIRQFAGQKGKKAFVLARCFGCGFSLPLLIHSEGKVEAIDVDPYRDVQEASEPADLSSIPSDARNNAEADLSYQQGATAFEQENYIEAYRNWKAAYGWYATRPDERKRSAALLSNIGMALSGLRMPLKALSCFEVAIERIDPVEDQLDYATVLNNIGAEYLKMGDLRNAEEYHRRGYEMYIKGGGNTAVIDHRGNLAFTYGKIASRETGAGNLEEAIRRARQAVALYDASDETEGRIYFVMLGSLLRRKAESAVRADRLREALDLYTEAADMHSRGDVDRQMLFADYDELGRLQRRLGFLEESLASMQRADELLEEITKQNYPV